MAFLDKLFGKRNIPAAPSPTKTSADLRQDPNQIQVFDDFGRELFISKQEWRKSILPENIKKNWNNAEKLYGDLLSALNDGFFEDIISAAERLQSIDTNFSRGTCVYAIVLMKNGRLQDAERILLTHIQQHGEDGSVLTNLAKVHSAQNEPQRADEVLWHSIELDPNQENGLAWYLALQRERNGEEAALDACRRIAAIPSSWRAQLWLARAALKNHDLQAAIALYRDALARVGSDVPTDCLMQISGDLGKSGYLNECLQLTALLFVPESHGLKVGNNLIKAHLDLGQVEQANNILERLYALNRPDWKTQLNFWNTEIAKARISTISVPKNEKLEATLLSIDGPVWLNASSPVSKAFPEKNPTAKMIVFLAATAAISDPPGEITLQMSNTPGRLTRAVPLFLAEQVHFSSEARVQTLIPWIVTGPGGFALYATPYSDECALGYARKAPHTGEFLVVTHFETTTTPWKVDLRVLRTLDGHAVGELRATFDPFSTESGIAQLSRDLLGLLSNNAELKVVQPDPLYQAPTGIDFDYYLLRLEQLLSLRSAASQESGDSHLSGEREIMDGNLQLCVSCPKSVVARSVLLYTSRLMKQLRPAIVSEYRYKIMLLQSKHPIVGPAGRELLQAQEVILAD